MLIPWEEGGSAALAIGNLVLVIELSSVHTQALLLVCSRKRDGKTGGLIARRF